MSRQKFHIWQIWEDYCIYDVSKIESKKVFYIYGMAGGLSKLSKKLLLKTVLSCPKDFIVVREDLAVNMKVNYVDMLLELKV